MYILSSSTISSSIPSTGRAMSAISYALCWKYNIFNPKAYSLLDTSLVLPLRMSQIVFATISALITVFIRDLIRSL